MSNFNIKIDYEKSHGSYVYDKNSSRFILDFHSHFSSLPLGYNHPVLKSKEYLDEICRVAHVKTSMCEYDSDERQKFMEVFQNFINLNGFDFIHYCSTGSLAVETGYKIAMHHHKYRRKKILSLTNSFHGVNSIGNYITTSSRLNGIPSHPQFTIDTIESILKWCGDKYLDSVCAIIVEPIQCTSGDVYVETKKLLSIRELCTKHGIVLIFDEVQTGLSTGSNFYFQEVGVEPDIIVFGKKFQTSGVIVKKGFDSIRNDAMRISVTFDGCLTDFVRSKYVLREIKDKKLLEKSILTGNNFRDLLSKIEPLKNVRGMGSLTAFDFDAKEIRDTFVNKCFENGLMVNPTGDQSVRLRPNLCTTVDEYNNALSIIKRSV